MLEKNSKRPVSNNIVIYVLFCIIIFLISANVSFLYLNLKQVHNTNKSDDSKQLNAQLIINFFKDGYQYKNFDKVFDYMVENYIDNSPAAARSNKEVVKILKSEILDLTCEKDMVAARIWYKVKHIGTFNNIPATGKTITFEALENFKVVNGKIVESWGSWPDKGIEIKLLANETN